MGLFGLAPAARAQMSFQGLDLNDDHAAKPKKKPTAKVSAKPSPKKAAAKKAAPQKVAAKKAAKKVAKPVAKAAAKKPQPKKPAQPPPPARPAEEEEAAATPTAASEAGAAAAKPAPAGNAPKPTAETPKAAAVPAGPAPVVLPGLKKGGPGPERSRLEAIAQMYKEGHYEEAAGAAYGAMLDSTRPRQAAESEYLLAKSLYQMKMYHSSLHHFSRVLARGEKGKFFKPSLEWLLFISRKTVDDSIVLDDVARYPNAEFPVRYQSEFRYLLARYQMERAEALLQAGQLAEGRASLKEAQRLLDLVPSTSPFFVKARFLAGTAAYQDAEIGAAPGVPADAQALLPALAAFKDVIRATNPRADGTFLDWRTRDLAFMNLARIHYEARQNRNAIYYYGKVVRGGEQWLEALYEAGWAYYRMGDDERALGNMITLHSPFFKDEYFPESLTVKAIIYYENCRYEEANAAVDDFERIYGPVQQELEKITAKEQRPEALYELLDDIQRKQRSQGSNPLLDRILKLALSDQELRRRNDSIQELEKELDGIGESPEGFRYGDLAKALQEDLKSERQVALNQAGLSARAKLELERDDLKDLLGKALRIRFEIQEKKKESLEQSLTDQPGKPEELRRYRYSVAVGDGDEYWPYEGEYWRDELGTYQYTLTKGCRQNLSAGRQ
jgi:hypothetical protein